MIATNPTTFVLLFSLSITVTYLVVRLGWLHIYQAFVIGSIVNSAFFFMFSIARDNSFGHALTVGLCLGLIFTALSVTLGRFFKHTEIDYAVHAVNMAAESLKS